MSAHHLLVTGGSRGIGLSLCNLASKTHAVFTCGRGPRPAELAESVVYHRVDISDPEAVARWFDDVPAVDVLVNNAALLGERATIAQTSVKAWSDAVSVNVNGAFFVTRASLEKSPKIKVIVNVSSSVGRAARAEWGAYSVSKCALEGLNEILRQELPHTHVISVNPGGTATEMRANAFPEEEPATLPSADEIATTILKVIENASRFSGQQVNCRDLL